MDSNWNLFTGTVPEQIVGYALHTIMATLYTLKSGTADKGRANLQHSVRSLDIDQPIHGCP